MFIRIRVALGLTFVMIFLTSITAFAKGGFSFIAINGPSLKAEVRSSDPALTEDFFAFADFYRNKTGAPAEPGPGYEVTRCYIEGARVVVFDHLHYYPNTGFVFYDGIAGGGWSEYDGKWYTAKAEVRTAFEKALTAVSGDQNEPAKGFRLVQSNIWIGILATALTGLAIVLMLASRFWRSSAH